MILKYVRRFIQKTVAKTLVAMMNYVHLELDKEASKRKAGIRHAHSRLTNLTEDIKPLYSALANIQILEAQVFSIFNQMDKFKKQGVQLDKKLKDAKTKTYEAVGSTNELIGKLEIQKIQLSSLLNQVDGLQKKVNHLDSELKKCPIQTKLKAIEKKEEL